MILSENLHPTTKVSWWSTGFSGGCESEVPCNTYADNVPLTLGAKEEEEFPEVVNETCYLHPFRLAVSPDGLSSLEEVLNLGEAGLYGVLAVTCGKLVRAIPTSGSDSSTRVFKSSIASQTPIQPRLRLLKSTRALMLNAIVCFSKGMVRQGEVGSMVESAHRAAPCRNSLHGRTRCRSRGRTLSPSLCRMQSHRPRGGL